MLEYSSQRLTFCSFRFNGLKRIYLMGFLFFLISPTFMTLSGCAKQSQSSIDGSNCARTESVTQVLAEASPAEAEHQKAALVNVELGLHYLAEGQIARAKHKLVHAVTLAPNAAETHSALAYFFEKVGDSNEAMQEHKKALRLGGVKAKGALSNNYAVFLYRQNRFKEAKQAFQLALQDKHYVHSAEVNENAGLCALKLSELKQAENYFNTAIQQDPKRAVALLELAGIMLKQKKKIAAKEFLDRHHALVKPSTKSISIHQGLLSLEQNTVLSEKNGIKTGIKI